MISCTDPATGRSATVDGGSSCRSSTTTTTPARRRRPRQRLRPPSSRKQCFGPVLSISKVRDEDEAVKRANDSEEGLGSTVFTRDRGRGDRLAARIAAGSTIVNDSGVAALPLADVRASGFGRRGGRVGNRELCSARAVVVDRFAGVRMPARLFPAAADPFEKTKATLQVLYGRSLGDRARGLGALGCSLRG